MRQLLVLDPEQRPAVPLAALRNHEWFSPWTPFGRERVAPRRGVAAAAAATAVAAVAAVADRRSEAQVEQVEEAGHGVEVHIADAAPKTSGRPSRAWRQCMCHIL